MPWDSALNDLRDVLAGLYPTEEDARQLVAVAGLNAQHIAFSNKAVNNWTNILLYASNNEQIADVVREAREQFARNTALKAAERTWLASRSPQPERVEPQPVGESERHGP